MCNLDVKICRRPGGDRIYGVFDNQLPAALRKLPFDRYLSLQNVKRVVSEADGYQPHLIAPEQGYRRLIETGLNYFRGPAEASVDAVRILFLCPKKECSCGCLVSYVSSSKSLLLPLQVHNVLKELVRKSIGETEVGYLALSKSLLILLILKIFNCVDDIVSPGIEKISHSSKGACCCMLPLPGEIP